MNHRPPGSLLIGGSLIVAALSITLAEGGWLIGVPVLLAVLVVSHLRSKVEA